MIDFKKHHTEAGTLVVRVNGQLDHETNEYFFKCMEDEISAGNCQIVINFAELGYISSIGLGALVRASSRAAKAGGVIYLSRIENQILDIFRLVHFEKIFNIYETEHEAIAAIEASARK